MSTQPLTTSLTPYSLAFIASAEAYLEQREHLTLRTYLGRVRKGKAVLYLRLTAEEFVSKK